MKQTMELLWNGQLAPGATSGVHDPQMEELTVLLDRNRTKLEKVLDEPQKKLLERYVACSDEFTYLSSTRAFCDGFTLAVKLLTEALAD